MEDEKLLLTIAEAAYKLNCSSSFVNNLIHSNQLQYTIRRHNYYIFYNSLVAYVESMQRNKQVLARKGK